LGLQVFQGGFRAGQVELGAIQFLALLLAESFQLAAGALQVLAGPAQFRQRLAMGSRLLFEALDLPGQGGRLVFAGLAPSGQVRQLLLDLLQLGPVALFVLSGPTFLAGGLLQEILQGAQPARL